MRGQTVPVSMSAPGCAGDLGQLRGVRVGDVVDAGALADGVSERLAGPRGGEVDVVALVGEGRAAEDAPSHLVQEALQAVGDGVVVAVGLVPLEHGELGEWLRSKPSLRKSLQIS
jgi:hypothetical protein